MNRGAIVKMHFGNPAGPRPGWKEIQMAKARKFPKMIIVVDNNSVRNSDESFFSIEDSDTSAEENAKGGRVATYQLMKVERLTRDIVGTRVKN
jgi:hypothetical protein